MNIKKLTKEELEAQLKILIETTYTVVEFPENQFLMEKRWFRKEAILDTDGLYGSSAYLVPTKRLHNLKKQ